MSLTSALANLVFRADDARGQIKEIVLERGLIVALRITAQYTTLRLTRKQGTPGISEWRAVIDYWPDPKPYNIEGPEKQNNDTTLVGRWRTQSRLIVLAPASTENKSQPEAK